MNVDDTLVASVDQFRHCLYVYSVADRAVDSVVGTVGTAGSAHGQLCSPRVACFVHRGGVDTLLISDFGNCRVVEVTARGCHVHSRRPLYSSR